MAILLGDDSERSRVPYFIASHESLFKRKGMSILPSIRQSKDAMTMAVAVVPGRDLGRTCDKTNYDVIPGRLGIPSQLWGVVGGRR